MFLRLSHSSLTDKLFRVRFLLRNLNLHLVGLNDVTSKILQIGISDIGIQYLWEELKFKNIVI